MYKLLLLLITSGLMADSVTIGYTNTKSTTTSNTQIKFKADKDFNISDVENTLEGSYEKNTGKIESENDIISLLSTYKNVYSKETYIKDTERFIDNQYKIGIGLSSEYFFRYRLGVQYSYKDFIDNSSQGRTYTKFSIEYKDKVFDNSKIKLTADIAYHPIQRVSEFDAEFSTPIKKSVYIGVSYKATEDSKPDFEKLPKFYSKTFVFLKYDFGK